MQFLQSNLVQHLFTSGSMHYIRKYSWEILNQLPVPNSVKWLIVAVIAFFMYKAVKSASKIFKF